ncbi:MAG: flagellar hook-length control protein FliK [Lachnospiraceae bacterium]|nr:flagellar hook-length control protein FliK [Lachnospiraceae bacterium]
MVSSSVKTMSFLSNQAVCTRKEISSESKTEDFAAMMDKSINKAKETTPKEVEKEENVKETKDMTKTEEKTETKEVDSEVEVKDEVCETKEVEELPEEDLVTEEVSEEILNVIAAVLNVSVEDLKNSLEKLNMDVKDLLDIENVTKLVMDIENIDTKFDLLVHSDANNDIKQIQSSIEEIINEVKSNLDNKTTEDTLVENVDVNVKVPETDGSKETVKNDEEVQEVVEKVTTEQTENVAQKEETGNETGFDKSGQKDDFDKSQKKDSTIDNAIENFRNDIVNEIEVELEQRVDSATAVRIVREISDNITFAIREKLTTLEMQLNPENLGKVTVMLATEESGITAKITAETEMAKNAIEQQLTILKENFEKQGLKVTEIEVTIASHSFEQNLDKESDNKEQQQNKNNGIRRSLLDEINGIQSEEVVEEKDIVMQTLGNTVSYLA